MNKKTPIFLLIVTLIFTACTNKPKTTNEQTKVQKTETNELIETNQLKNDSLVDFSKIWENLPLKNVPVLDTTNFDNITDVKEFNKQEIKMLQLDKMYPEIDKEGYTFRFMPSYKLKLSDQFYTIVLNVYKGENELESILIHYDLEKRLSQYYSEDGALKTNSLVIAYDEIAEGWSRKHGKIEQQFVTVIDEFYGNTTQIDTTQFQITPNGDIHRIKKKFTSNIRLGEAITLDKTYTDTIMFSAYNDDYDYRMIEGEKRGTKVSLVYQWDRDTHDAYHFKYGDFLVVEWKMDSIFLAGDGETLDFREWAINAKRIASHQKPVKFLWREEKFDEKSNQDVNSIFLNESFIESISNPEKAALAFVATFIGNECSWDGRVNEDRSNLRCKILTALDLGYQCSEQHLGFLRNWFSKDAIALKKLTACGTMPEGATVQTTFDEIFINTDKEAKTISVTYEVQGIHMRESKSWNYTQIDYFEYTNETIQWLNSEKSQVIEKTFDNNLDKQELSTSPKASKSFVISCGSGCAMTYSEQSRIKKEHVIETVFKVERYTNEKRIEEYVETYVFSCANSNKTEQITRKGDSDFNIENQHPVLQEHLTSYVSQVCE
ncbi:hypothetical protein ACFO3O_19345 [Dokdonia ponticola]|uniref:Lipoprotein n=1 Tax=Dokdonia ponticola TaxID=2041041 RepID=A0ABV9I182_9FLAO